MKNVCIWRIEKTEEDKIMSEFRVETFSLSIEHMNIPKVGEYFCKVFQLNKAILKLKVKKFYLRIFNSKTLTSSWSADPLPKLLIYRAINSKDWGMENHHSINCQTEVLWNIKRSILYLILLPFRVLNGSQFNYLLNHSLHIKHLLLLHFPFT